MDKSSISILCKAVYMHPFPMGKCQIDKSIYKTLKEIPKSFTSSDTICTRRDCKHCISCGVFVRPRPYNMIKQYCSVLEIYGCQPVILDYDICHQCDTGVYDFCNIHMMMHKGDELCTYPGHTQQCRAKCKCGFYEFLLVQQFRMGGLRLPRDIWILIYDFVCPKLPVITYNGVFSTKGQRKIYSDDELRGINEDIVRDEGYHKLNVQNIIEMTGNDPNHFRRLNDAPLNREDVDNPLAAFHRSGSRMAQVEHALVSGRHGHMNMMNNTRTNNGGRTVITGDERPIVSQTMLNSLHRGARSGIVDINEAPEGQQAGLWAEKNPGKGDMMARGYAQKGITGKIDEEDSPSIKPEDRKIITRRRFLERIAKLVIRKNIKLSDLSVELAQILLNHGYLKEAALPDIMCKPLNYGSRCGRCSSSYLESRTVTARAGDEASTIFFTCRTCGNKWKN